MIKRKYLNPIHELTTCLVATHYGAEGYGGVPRAAQIAVDEFGVGWLSSSPKLVKDRKMREFLRTLTKLSCPPSHSNADQPWQVLQREAEEYAASLQPVGGGKKK
jgi:hypothetical protein